LVANLRQKLELPEPGRAPFSRCVTTVIPLCSEVLRRAKRELLVRCRIFNRTKCYTEITQMLSTVLIVILILLLVGALPTWGYSSGWGYGPGGILGLVLVVVVILALIGRI
jgi:Protein of unknown function (DUF3309)